MLDIDKLVKLLNLACSADAHESHNAMVHAGKMLRKANLKWEQVIRNPNETIGDMFKRVEWDSPVKTNAKPSYYSNKSHEDIIKDHYYDNVDAPGYDPAGMFKFLLACHLSDKTLGFVTSLKSQFEAKGFLSTRQYDKLFQTYLRHGGQI